MMLCTSFVFLPLSLLLMPFWKRQNISPKHFFALGVNFKMYPKESIEAIYDLGISRILLRLRLDELDQLEPLKAWLLHFKDFDITLQVIYVPNFDKKSYEAQLEKIFTTLSPQIGHFQIANAINRAKWGFFSVRGFLNFYRIAYRLKKKRFTSIKLLGPSVIDFEYYYTAQALFNLFNIRYDALSAALYVDRAGSPENRQMGFDLSAKISWLYSLMRLSPKCDNHLHITEVNWPLIGSGKYAPTSEKECVSQEAMANYMVRYYLLALGSQKVEAVYWHQLIAVGFGLINPKHDLQKRSAYDAFKTMVSELKEAKNIKLIKMPHYYALHYTLEGIASQVLWTNDTPYILKLNQKHHCLSRDGKSFHNDTLWLSGEPIYLKEAL